MNSGGCFVNKVLQMEGLKKCNTHKHIVNGCVKDWDFLGASDNETNSNCVFIVKDYRKEVSHSSQEREQLLNTSGICNYCK
jgi:hypothetical protein